jgi:hypothetical protein
MTENGSGSLSFESPELENIRLREENARLRRLLAVHSIPIPQLTHENPSLTKTVESVPPVDNEERQKENCAISQPVSREGRCIRAAMGERRWPERICASGRKGLESYQQKPPGGPEEDRPED